MVKGSSELRFGIQNTEVRIQKGNYSVFWLLTPGFLLFTVFTLEPYNPLPLKLYAILRDDYLRVLSVRVQLFSDRG